jgi:hypothetical protein
MNLREAAQQALEALEFDGFTPEDATHRHYTTKAITALRAALAENERDWSLLEATQESLREHMAEIKTLRDAMEQADKPKTIAEWWAEKQTASGEPDMKHPKIQALIGGKARREIELQIVEQLLDDPDCDLSAMDMEYWHGLHDKLREKLTAALAQPAPDAVPVAWALCPTDIYDFAGWLTTRPGTLVVGSSHKAGPMAEAVGEYLRKFPDRFAAHPQPAPLTDEQIDQITAEQWGRGLGAPYAAYRAYARAIEAACGITAKEAP